MTKALALPKKLPIKTLKQVAGVGLVGFGVYDAGRVILSKDLRTDIKANGGIPILVIIRGLLMVTLGIVTLASK